MFWRRADGLALGLALLVNQRLLRAGGFFRTAFYFPSVASSVAICPVFVFLFSGGGASTPCQAFGLDGPKGSSTTGGCCTSSPSGGDLGPTAARGGADPRAVAGADWWEWVSGPTVALSAIIPLVVWTTAGTFTPMFLAALQELPIEVTRPRLDGVGLAGAGAFGHSRISQPSCSW